MLELTVRAQVAAWTIAALVRQRSEAARRGEVGASVLALMIVVAIVSAAAIVAATTLGGKITGRASSIPD